MKHTDLFTSILTVLILLFSSCSSYIVEEEENNDKDDKGYSILFTLADKTGSIVYPAKVYIFNEDKSLRKSLETDRSTLECKLPKGKYTISVLSPAQYGYLSLPEETSWEEAIKMPETLYSRTPLFMSTSSLNIHNNTETSLTINPIVSQMSIGIQNIPSDAKSVTACISPVSSGIFLKGEYTNDHMILDIPLTNTQGIWTSDKFYILPSSGSLTKISINIEFPQQTQTYNYTLAEPLVAQGIYNIKGKYNGEADNKLELEGNFGIDGWEEATEVEIELLPGNKPDTDDGNQEKPENPDYNDTIITEGELPESECLWGNFFVWKAEPTGTNEIKATLISTNQYMSYASDAKTHMSQLDIDGISGWRFPTKEEGIALYKQYNADNLHLINQFFIDYGKPIFKNEEGDRYLCDNGNTTFCFYSSRTYAAGAKTKYYYRGVKVIKIIKR